MEQRKREVKRRLTVADHLQGRDVLQQDPVLLLRGADHHAARDGRHAGLLLHRHGVPGGPVHDHREHDHSELYLLPLSIRRAGRDDVPHCSGRQRQIGRRDIEMVLLSSDFSAIESCSWQRRRFPLRFSQGPVMIDYRPALNEVFTPAAVVPASRRTHRI